MRKMLVLIAFALLLGGCADSHDSAWERTFEMAWDRTPAAHQAEMCWLWEHDPDFFIMDWEQWELYEPTPGYEREKLERSMNRACGDDGWSLF